MATLFPLEPLYPPGFSYEENFITPAEEADLIKTIEDLTLHTFMFQGYEAKRKVASFGYDWNFDTRTLKRGNDIPLSFQPLMQKIADHLNINLQSIAELLVTQYDPGTVINWHRDAPPFDTIIGLSLNTDCTFKLRPHPKELQTRSATQSLLLRRRSLYVMSGTSRSDWQHSIAPVKSLRYSITLRTLKANP